MLEIPLLEIETSLQYEIVTHVNKKIYSTVSLNSKT